MGRLKKVVVEGNWETRQVWIDNVKIYPNAAVKELKSPFGGLSWGYKGSAPENLSMAILLHVLGKDNAKYAHKEFYDKVVSRIEKSDFMIEIKIMKSETGTILIEYTNQLETNQQ